jgi:Domain of unknown function (DUF4419)
MNSLTSATFHVSDVKPATKPLPEVPYKEAVEKLLMDDTFEDDIEFGDEMESQDLSIALAESSPSRSIEACTRYHGRLLANVAFHPVVAAVHRAFTGHRPLCLSPDMIWLMIIQGVANHVNAHAQDLRPQLVSHQGQIQIEVRRDDFVKGSPENPWPEVLSEFSDQIRQHIGQAIDLFLPRFSTTGQVDLAASHIVLLDAVRSYFDYDLDTLCGIPAITLEGTPEDWQAISDRLEGFSRFDLDWWLKPLRPILQQFIEASRGIVDHSFWESLYKFHDESGGSLMTGWLSTLFPYLREEATNGALVRNLWLAIDSQQVEVEYDDLDYDDPIDEDLVDAEQCRKEWEPAGPKLGLLPSGLSSAPFRWNYLDRSLDMEFLGGFVGVAQDQETLTLRPEIGWAVRETPAAE